MLTTTVSYAVWSAITLRNYTWSGMNPPGKLAVMRLFERWKVAGADSPQGAVLNHWGGAAARVVRTGPAHAMHVERGVGEQKRIITEATRHYLGPEVRVTFTLAEQILRTARGEYFTVVCKTT